MPSSPVTHPLTEWPGAFGAYKPSRDAVHRSLSTLVWLFLISTVGSGLFSIVLHRLGFVAQLVEWVIGVTVTAAITFVVIQSVRGKRIELNESLQVAFRLFVKVVLLNILVGLTLLGGFILFIIPGLILLPRLSLASYFLIDQDLGVMEAYKASWYATKGHSGKVWGLIGVAILMTLPIITIVGIVVSVYLLFMYSAALALLYQYLLKAKPSGAPAATA